MLSGAVAQHPTTASSCTKSSCVRASRSTSAPSLRSSSMLSGAVEQDASSSTSSTAARALRVTVSPLLAQRLGHVPQDREHRVVEAHVVHDRHAVLVGELEDVVLDAQDRI